MSNKRPCWTGLPLDRQWRVFKYQVDNGFQKWQSVTFRINSVKFKSSTLLVLNTYDCQIRLPGWSTGIPSPSLDPGYSTYSWEPTTSVWYHVYYFFLEIQGSNALRCKILWTASDGRLRASQGDADLLHSTLIWLDFNTFSMIIFQLRALQSWSVLQAYIISSKQLSNCLFGGENFER